MESNHAVSTNIAGFPALRTRVETTNPILLFVHGAFVGHAPFQPWMEFLAARGWQSVAASRRGRAGIGPERANGLTIADYIADTVKVIEALGETPIVIGHSLGGLIAQKIAELGKAAAAVLLCPAPAGKLPAQPVAFPVYLPMFPRILAGRPILPGPKGCSTIALNRMPANERPAFHRTLVHESGKVYREMIFGTFKVDFSKIRCPVMVAGGREDRIVAPDVVEWTAKQLGVSARIYEDHAHWLLAEPGWERIAAEVSEFLATVSQTRGPRLVSRQA
jgi:pimeloyl-ACP methyl ester carboxylesterase